MINWQGGSQHGPAVCTQAENLPRHFSVLCHDSLCHIPVTANLLTSVCPICCGAVSKELDMVWGRSLDLPAAAEELREQNQALHELELAQTWCPGCSQVIAGWDVLLMLLRLAQSTAPVTGRWKIPRGINGNALRLSEQRSKSLRKLLSEERRTRLCAATPAGSGRGHCPHSRQILWPSLFIQALPFALGFALQGLEKTSLQKYQEEYTGMYSEFKSFWN